MNSQPWHVLHVCTNHEKRVARHLEVRSLEYYLPTFCERVKWTDRSVITERPLFPGYVFARFTLADRISIISISGVVRDFGNEERNMISAEEIEKIRAGLTSGLLMRPHPWLVVGTRVRICRGIFAGAEGIVKELRQECRVILTLAATQQCFSIEIEGSALELVHTTRPMMGHDTHAYAASF